MPPVYHNIKKIKFDHYLLNKYIQCPLHKINTHSHLADAVMFEKSVLVITGSDIGIIKEDRIKFSGRCGIYRAREKSILRTSGKWPVEVKWTRRIRPHELKQIKYSNGC